MQMQSSFINEFLLQTGIGKNKILFIGIFLIRNSVANNWVSYGYSVSISDSMNDGAFGENNYWLLAV